MYQEVALKTYLKGDFIVRLITAFLVEKRKRASPQVLSTQPNINRSSHEFMLSVDQNGLLEATKPLDPELASATVKSD